MITIQKHSSFRLTGHVGARPANPSLPSSLSKLVGKSAPAATATTERKQIANQDENLTAGMRRIYEQYKAGTYDANSYSQRSCQRHRKYFLSMGIDLRIPFCPSTTAKVSVPIPQAVQRAQSVKNKMKMVKPLQAPEHETTNSEPTFCKTKYASNILSKVHRTRIHQRRSGEPIGLGAIAKRPCRQVGGYSATATANYWSMEPTPRKEVGQ